MTRLMVVAGTVKIKKIENNVPKMLNSSGPNALPTITWNIYPKKLARIIEKNIKALCLNKELLILLNINKYS